MKNKLIGLVCCLVTLNAFGADKAIIVEHSKKTLLGFDAPSGSKTIKLPSDERVRDILMGCDKYKCFHTIVTVKKDQTQSPYTYILRTFREGAEGGTTTIKETE